MTMTDTVEENKKINTVGTEKNACKCAYGVGCSMH